MAHFYRNVFSATPRARMTEVAAMLKAIHAQESKEAAREKAQAVVRKLQKLKLKEAAKKVEAGIEESRRRITTNYQTASYFAKDS